MQQTIAAATYQPELTMWAAGDNLTGMKGRVFDPVCLLDHKYYLNQSPDCFFIVRHSQYSKEFDEERVCLYQDGVVNTFLRPDDKPFTNLLANELRAGRKIETLFKDMEEKAERLKTTTRK